MAEPWWPSAVYAGEVVYPPGGTYGPLLQRWYQLVLLHTGCLDLTIDGTREFHYDAGTVLLLTPGHTVYLRFASESFTRHSWVTVVGPELPADWWQPSDDRPPAIGISTHMHSLVKEAVYWYSLRNAKRLLLTIGCHALQLFFQELATTAGKMVNKQDAVCLVEWYIWSNYKKELTLSDLSKQAGVSKEHLCRLFHQEHGMGPMAYLWRYRTRQALQLLATTGLSVADIAAACGFKTPSHLHDRVKALTGLSPSQYREQHWGRLDSSQA